jgi:hypothetical protein
MLQSLTFSAFKYSQRNYSRARSDPIYKYDHRMAKPNIGKLVAQTYMMLKNDVRVALINLETDKQLFLDSFISFVL